MIKLARVHTGIYLAPIVGNIRYCEMILFNFPSRAKFYCDSVKFLHHISQHFYIFILLFSRFLYLSFILYQYCWLQYKNSLYWVRILHGDFLQNGQCV